MALAQLLQVAHTPGPNMTSAAQQLEALEPGPHSNGIDAQMEGMTRGMTRNDMLQLLHSVTLKPEGNRFLRV